MTQLRPWFRTVSFGQRLRLGLDALIATFSHQVQAISDLTLRLGLAAFPAKVKGVACAPRDYKPPNLQQGQAILAGEFAFMGGKISIGPEGNPWAMASPNRQFAAELHGFGWLSGLIAQGPEGCERALRLVLKWHREFGHWNPFSWDRAILERRVHAQACHLRALSQVASDRENAILTSVLLRQGRFLLPGSGHRRTEQAVIAAIAGCVLNGPSARRLQSMALERLITLLHKTVLADGGHVSRSPEAALFLLLDLLSLDDGLSQKGQASPPAIAQAINRLTLGLRFFTLPDGGLAGFQGGEAVHSDAIASARAHDDQNLDPSVAQQARQSGYQRLQTGSVAVIIDVGLPASGAFAQTACAQPLALEIVCGRDRLVTNGGWSPRLSQAQAYRLTSAGSTACLGQSSAGQILEGGLAKALGPRLVGAASAVQFQRHEVEQGLFLDASHNGWLAEFGLMHERRLFLQHSTDELRGEDRFVASREKRSSTTIGRAIRLDVFFHLHPLVRPSLAHDRRSVLLITPTAGGWRLRTDAAVVSVEQGLCFVDGLPRRTQKIVLRDSLARTGGNKIRWKLARADGAHQGGAA